MFYLKNLSNFRILNFGYIVKSRLVIQVTSATKEVPAGNP